MPQPPNSVAPVPKEEAGNSDLAGNSNFAGNSILAGNSVSGSSSPEKKNILKLGIRSKSALHAAYMPYVATGGLFVPTRREFVIGDEVFIILTLLEDKNPIAFAGRVVWISPAGVGGRYRQGIGVAFPQDERGRNLLVRIESTIESEANSSRDTLTL